MFTTSPDEEINNFNGNFDSLLVALFSADEREDMLILRSKNVNKGEAAPEELLNQLFDEFKAQYGKSFLAGTPQEKDEFASYFLPKLAKVSHGGCGFPDLGCSDEIKCPATPNQFTYVQRKIVGGLIATSHECIRQTGTTDCDNSYYWTSASVVYNNFGGFDFSWYCDNTFYRAFMDDAISGFRSDTPFEFGTHLGIQHELTMATTWFLSGCPQDRWVESTRFQATARTAPTGRN